VKRADYLGYISLRPLSIEGKDENFNLSELFFFSAAALISFSNCFSLKISLMESFCCFCLRNKKRKVDQKSRIVRKTDRERQEKYRGEGEMQKKGEAERKRERSWRGRRIKRKKERQKKKMEGK
jgi:hypothetical protein